MNFNLFFYKKRFFTFVLSILFLLLCPRALFSADQIPMDLWLPNEGDFQIPKMLSCMKAAENFVQASSVFPSVNQFYHFQGGNGVFPLPGESEVLIYMESSIKGEAKYFRASIDSSKNRKIETPIIFSLYGAKRSPFGGPSSHMILNPPGSQSEGPSGYTALFAPIYSNTAPSTGERISANETVLTSQTEKQILEVMIRRLEEIAFAIAKIKNSKVEQSEKRKLMTQYNEVLKICKGSYHSGINALVGSKEKGVGLGSYLDSLAFRVRVNQGVERIDPSKSEDAPVKSVNPNQ